MTVSAIRAPSPDIANHQIVLSQLKEETETGRRIRGNANDSFVTLGELISAGIVNYVGKVISPGSKIANSTGGGLTSVSVTDSITGAGTTASPIKLVGDVTSPGNNMLYGTNGSGARGWYTQPSGGSYTPPVTTKGDLFTYGTTPTRLGVGTDGQVLTARSTAADGIDWETPSSGGSVSVTDGTHTVSGATSITFSGATVSGTSPNATVTVSSGTSSATGGWTRIFSNTFASNFTGFTNEQGTWAITGGVLQQTDTSPNPNRLILTQALPYATLRITCDVLLQSAGGGSTQVGAICINDGSSSTNLADIGLRWASGAPLVDADEFGSATIASSSYNWGALNTWHTLQLIIAGERHSFYIDGVAIFSYIAPSNWNNFQYFGLFAYGSAVSYRNFYVDTMDTSPLAVGTPYNVTPDTHTNIPAFAANDYFEEGSLDTGGTRFSGATPWAWLNQGSSTATLGNGLLFLQAPTQGSFTYNLTGIIQAMPTGNVTYQASIEDVQIVNSSGQYTDLGIILYESATGKCVSFYFYNYSAGNGMGVDYWNSPTSHAGSVLQTGTTCFMNGNTQVGTSYEGLFRTVYLQFKILSGTIYCNYSFTGAPGSWITFTSFSVTAHFTTAPDHIGIAIDNIQVSSQPAIIVDSFIRTA